MVRNSNFFRTFGPSFAVSFIRPITTVILSITDPPGSNTAAVVALEQVRSTRVSCSQRASFRLNINNVKQQNYTFNSETYDKKQQFFIPHFISVARSPKAPPNFFPKFWHKLSESLSHMQKYCRKVQVCVGRRATSRQTDGRTAHDYQTHCKGDKGISLWRYPT